MEIGEVNKSPTDGTGLEGFSGITMTRNKSAAGDGTRQTKTRGTTNEQPFAIFVGGRIRITGR